MTDPAQNTPRCLVCERTSDEVALLSLTYRGAGYYICAPHLPILIHRPEQLAHILPGAENFGPSAEH